MAAKDYWWILQQCAQGTKLSKYTRCRAVDPGVIRIRPDDKGNEYSFDPSLEIDAKDYYILPPLAWWDEVKQRDVTWRSRVQAFMEFVVADSVKLIPLMEEYGYVQFEYEQSEYKRATIAYVNAGSYSPTTPPYNTPPTVSARLKWKGYSPDFALATANYSRYRDMACFLSKMYTVTAQTFRDSSFAPVVSTLPNDDPAWGVGMGTNYLRGFIDLVLDVPEWFRGSFSGHACVRMSRGRFTVYSQYTPGSGADIKAFPYVALDAYAEKYIFPSEVSCSVASFVTQYTVTLIYRLAYGPFFTFRTADRRYYLLKNVATFKALRTLAAIKDAATANGKTMTFIVQAVSGATPVPSQNGVTVHDIKVLNDTIVLECAIDNNLGIQVTTSNELDLLVITDAFELTDTEHVGIIHPENESSSGLTYEDITVLDPLSGSNALRSFKKMYTTGMCGLELGGKVVPAIPQNAQATDPVSEVFAYHNFGASSQNLRTFIGGGKATVPGGFSASYPSRVPNASRVSLYPGLVRTKQFMSEDPGWNAYDAAWFRAMLPAFPLYVCYTDGSIRLHDAAEVARNGALTEANTILRIAPVCRDGITPTKVDAGSPALYHFSGAVQTMLSEGTYNGSKYEADPISQWIVGAFYGPAYSIGKLYRVEGILRQFLPDQNSVRGTADPFYPNYTQFIEGDGDPVVSYDQALPPHLTGTDIVIGSGHGYSESSGALTFFINGVLHWTACRRLGYNSGDVDGGVSASGGIWANFGASGASAIATPLSIGGSYAPTIEWDTVPLTYLGVYKAYDLYGVYKLASVVGKYPYGNPTSASGAATATSSATGYVSGNGKTRAGNASSPVVNVPFSNVMAFTPEAYGVEATIDGPPTLAFSATIEASIVATLSSPGNLDCVAYNFNPGAGFKGLGYSVKPRVTIPILTYSYKSSGGDGFPVAHDERYHFSYSNAQANIYANTNTEMPRIRSEVGTPIGSMASPPYKGRQDPFLMPCTGFISHDVPLFWRDDGFDHAAGWGNPTGLGSNANNLVALVGETSNIAHIGGRITKLTNRDPGIGKITGTTYKALRQGFDCIIAVDEANKLPVAINVLVLDPSKMATVLVGTVQGTSHIRISGGRLHYLTPSGFGGNNPFGMRQSTTLQAKIGVWEYTAKIAPMRITAYPGSLNSEWIDHGKWAFTAGVVDTSLISTKRVVKMRFKELPDGWEPIIGSYLEDVAEQASTMFVLDEKTKTYTLDTSRYSWDLPLFDKTTDMNSYYWIGLRHQPTGVIVRAPLPASTVFGPLGVPVFVPPNHPGNATPSTVPSGTTGPVI